jgi:para-nitrobenzyl esterase
VLRLRSVSASTLQRLVPLLVAAACGGPSASASSQDAGISGDTGGEASADAGTSDGGPGSDDGGALVTLQGGTLRGIVDGQTLSFRGVPYAAPPVGSLRFAPPSPPAPWNGVRDASHFASECVQPVVSGGNVSIKGAEDCLYLDVWTPAPIASGRPVMVFIHGGGFSQGSGSDPLYEAADLATHTQAVVVTIDYRLGALGFMAHPALSSEANPRTSGTYGSLDQVAALKWVKANIAAFGGDAARVTIFGESAGATSTGTLVASPLAAGLFRAAIFESGTIDVSLPTLAAAESAGQALADNLGCGGASSAAACLRGLSVDAIIYGTGSTDEKVLDRFAIGSYSFHPVVDGHFLADQPKALFARGSYNHVPIMLGNNAQEAGYFAMTSSIPAVSTQQDYTTVMNQVFGSNAAAILAKYPATNGVTPFDAYLAALTDGGFICGARATARALLANSGQSVYRYLFTDALRGPKSVYGSMHTLELFFLFRTLGSFNYPVSAQDDSVSTTLQTYWGDFAATGRPDDATSPVWPQNDAQGDGYLEIGATTQAKQGLHTSLCDFWDTLGYY